MNSENSKTSDAHRLKLNLMEKIDPLKGENRVPLSKLSTTHGRI